MIAFNVPAFLGAEAEYIQQVYKNRKLCGDGEFTAKCHRWFERMLSCRKALLTTSCTHALEMAAMLIDIQPGDEVILPSYTFVSTANAFVLRGARLVFVDIRPDTMNMDEEKIEQAITAKTKAIVPVHYAGVACEMDKIMDLAERYGLWVVEDAAQGVLSEYKGRKLGAIGHLGCYSFHETKNYNCGEGGALIINDAALVERAEIIREKGTNRSRFIRGQVDKYTWMDIGSSYLPSELNAAYLLAQLEGSDKILADRLARWDQYQRGLQNLVRAGRLELPVIPISCTHNGHMFYVKTKDIEERSQVIAYLKEQDIMSAFHYIPLHSAPAGLQFGRFSQEDRHTTAESERLLRLPLYYGLEKKAVDVVISCLESFYGESRGCAGIPGKKGAGL